VSQPLLRVAREENSTATRDFFPSLLLAFALRCRYSNSQANAQQQRPRWWHRLRRLELVVQIGLALLACALSLCLVFASERASGCA